jgi:hypothetical protein
LKTAPASTSPLGSRVDASAVAASRDGPEDSTSSMSPPPTAFVLFARLCPPPAIVRPWPRQRRRCGMRACPPSFDSTLSSSLSSSSSSSSRALTYYVVAIATSLDAPSPLSHCATASIATPPPLLPRQRLYHCASLAPAVGCCIVTSLAAPVPLLSCRRLSRSATSLVTPPPLLWRLTCAGWLSLRQLS